MKKTISVISAVLILLSTFGYAPQRIHSAPEQQTERVSVVEELRETNSDTYLLSDGSYECVVYSEDRYYKNTRGGYTEIDNTIIEAKRSDNLGDYAYKNVSSDTVFAFSGNAPSILIDTEKSDLSFVINDSRASSAVPGGAKEYAALFEYPLSGDNCIAYYDALQSTDIVYTSANGTLKEFIVLKDTNAPTSFVFDFKTEGLSAKKTTDGTVEFVDAKGEKVFELCKLFALDAAAEYTDKLNYSIEPVGKNRTRITVQLSRDYLNDPNRVFPILIDPSVMITGASKTYDSYVSAAKPNENFYMANVLRTGKDSPYGVRRTFIKFNIPASVTGSITNSYIRIKKQSGVAPTMRAYRVLDGWTSGTITWNNMPGYATAQQSALATHVSNDWYKINVTDIVSYWTVGAYANNGFVLKDNTENNTSHWTTFASSEAASPNKPELHIVYSPVLESDCVYMIKNVAKGKYLSVNGSTVKLANKDAMDGRQLWYVVANGTEYTLYSMGYKDPASHGANESMLKGGAGGSTPSFSTTAGNYTKWTVSKVESNYRLLNAVSGTSYSTITASSANNNISIVNAANANNYANWRFEKIETSTFNNYWGGSYVINGRQVQKGEKVHIRVDLTTSGAENVLEGGVLTDEDFEVALQWNGLSENIQIHMSNSTIPSGVTPFVVKIVGKNENSSFPGKTIPLDANGEKLIEVDEYGNIDPHSDDNWYGVKIELNLERLKDQTQINKQYTILHEFGHEFGHALKLSHPAENDYIQNLQNGRGHYANDIMVCSAMNNGKDPQEEGNLTCIRPTWHDIINLKNKWG